MGHQECFADSYSICLSSSLERSSTSVSWENIPEVKSNILPVASQYAVVMYYPDGLLETDLKHLYKQCPSKSSHTCPHGF